MITGSHNPPEDNGFKLACGPAPFTARKYRRLKNMIISKEFRSGSGTLKVKDVSEPFLMMLAEKVKLGPRSLKVAVDCGQWHCITLC